MFWRAPAGPAARTGQRRELQSLLAAGYPSNRGTAQRRLLLADGTEAADIPFKQPMPRSWPHLPRRHACLAQAASCWPWQSRRSCPWQVLWQAALQCSRHQSPTQALKVSSCTAKLWCRLWLTHLSLTVPHRHDLPCKPSQHCSSGTAYRLLETKATDVLLYMGAQLSELR
jgi:hypothetical protein